VFVSKFVNKVLEIVRMIPEGKVVSYGQAALMAGLPRGARFVGGVLHFRGENTPWWRVINNAGRISIGTSDLEHTATTQKEKLLSEGVAVDKKLNIDIEKYRWRPEPAVLEKLKLEEDYIQKIMEKYLL